MNDALTTVFVYGTLMPGERNAQVAGAEGAFTAQPATLRGFRLLHLTPEGYPAVIPGGAEELVRGHALTYTPAEWQAALPHLDALEGLDEVPPLYTREQVQLTLDTGQHLAAWVYLYARPDRLKRPGVTALPGGDWREVQGRSERGPDDK